MNNKIILLFLVLNSLFIGTNYAQTQRKAVTLEETNNTETDGNVKTNDAIHGGKLGLDKGAKDLVPYTQLHLRNSLELPVIRLSKINTTSTRDNWVWDFENNGNKLKFKYGTDDQGETQTAMTLNKKGTLKASRFKDDHGFDSWNIKTGLWDVNSTGINYNGGYTGVGTSSPSSILHIKDNNNLTFKLESNLLSSSAADAIKMNKERINRFNAELQEERLTPEEIAKINDEIASIQDEILAIEATGHSNYLDITNNSKGVIFNYTGNKESTLSILDYNDDSGVVKIRDNVSVDTYGTVKSKKLHISNSSIAQLRLQVAQETGGGSGESRAITQGYWDFNANGDELRINKNEGNSVLSLSDDHVTFYESIRADREGRLTSNTLSVANNKFNVYSNGKVGIGTSDAPVQPLEVAGDAIFGEGEDGSENGTEFIQIQGRHSKWNMAVENSGDGFYIGKYGNKDYLYIADNHNVGIGTSDPGDNFRLDVVGNVNAERYYGDGSELTGIKEGVWNENGARISYIGNVGVGTDNPSEKFQIGDRWTFHDGGTKIIGYNFDSQYPNGSFRLQDGYVSRLEMSQSGNIAFRFSGYGDANSEITLSETSLFLKNDGKIGVGTDSPLEKFQVNEGSNALTVNNNGDLRLSQNSKIYLKGGEGIKHGLGWYGSGTNGFATAETIDGPVLFGNLGGALGTTHTEEKIALQWDVDGDVEIPGKLFVNGVEINGESSSVWEQSGNDIFYNSGDVNIRNHFVFENETALSHAGPIHFKVSSSDADSPSSEFTTYCANYEPVYSWSAGSSNGEVTAMSLDATSWGTLLDVNGNILCHELLISLDSWEDRVFFDDYKLKPLAEVEEFIIANKHLPNIPSEKEIIDNGLNTGEMVTLQMQKIEELTLYIIELNKTLEEQNKLLEEQGDRINELEKK